MGGLTTPICVGTTSDDLSMAGINVVILEDACASQSFEGVSAQDAHAFALARFRYQFGQTMTSHEFSAFVRTLPGAAQPSPERRASVAGEELAGDLERVGGVDQPDDVGRVLEQLDGPGLQCLGDLQQERDLEDATDAEQVL